MPYSPLALFWSDIFRVGGGGESRIPPFSRILKVHWRFEAGCFLEGDQGGAERGGGGDKEEEEDEGKQHDEEDKQKQCAKDEKVERDPVTA